MERSHRHVELVAVGVLDMEILAVRASNREHLQTRVAADAVRLVHHRRPDAEFAQIANHALGVSCAAAPAAALGSAGAEELRFRDHRKRRRLDACAALQSTDRHREPGVARDELDPGIDQRRSQAMGPERFQQHLPAPRRLRNDEAAPGMRIEEILQESDWTGRPPVDRQRGWRGRRERHGDLPPVPSSAVRCSRMPGCAASFENSSSTGAKISSGASTGRSRSWRRFSYRSRVSLQNALAAS